MLNKNLLVSLISGLMLSTLSGCGGGPAAFQTPDTSSVPTNNGVVALKNFSILASEPQPTVIDPTTGVFTQTSVTMTANIADRRDITLSDAHTVYFRAEYGVFDTDHCVTTKGKCSVTWTATKRPVTGGPGSDLKVTIIAYTTGEESFTDKNGNFIYDDADGNTFDDQEEPYVDANENKVYDTGEEIVDTVNGNDLTGKNGVHDIADGFFNGSGCQHSSLCSQTVINNATIWTKNVLKIDGP